MKQIEFRRNIFLTIIGAGIGWLVGLSVSPVVSIVITSVTGLAAAIIAAMSGLEDKSNQSDGENKRLLINYRWQVNPLPLTVLVVGILLGSTLGILARNQSWLGSDVSIELRKWAKAGLTGKGYSQEEIIQKLFDSRVPAISNDATSVAGTATPVANASTALGTLLFSEDTTECKTLLSEALLSPGEGLIRELRSSTVKQLRNLPDIITDPQVLKSIVEEVLCADEAG